MLKIIVLALPIIRKDRTVTSTAGPSFWITEDILYVKGSLWESASCGWV